jgi:hypothetical protein
MRALIISAATAVAALAAAAPAAAQYYPQPQVVPYGYNQQYGYNPQYGYGQPGYAQPQGYGYGYNYRDQQGLIRSYLVRADQLRHRIERLDNRDRINEREAFRLRAAAVDLQNRTRAFARDGLSSGERRDLEFRLARLEQAIRMEANDGRRGHGYGNGNGWGHDRDRDGVNDRYAGFIDRDRNGIDDRAEGHFRR